MAYRGRRRYRVPPPQAEKCGTPAVIPAGAQPVTDGVYGDISSFVHDALNVLVNPENAPNQHYFLQSQSHSDWYGCDCRSGKQVADKILNGWPEGRARLDELHAELLHLDVTPKDRRRRIRKVDFGDSVDIGDVYAGRLDTAWRIAKRMEGTGPQRVDLLANMICSGGESADTLFWRGAAAVVLANKLEQAGYMVRLVVGFGGSNWADDQPTSCRVTVKDYDKPLDECSIASVLMPGFFRGIGHAWLNGHTAYKRDMGGITVGMCRIEEGELILSHDVHDAASAQEWLRRQVDDFNSGGIVATE